MNSKTYYVYILASKKDGVLYAGVTSDLFARMYQHKNNLTEGFSKKYFIHRLVYFELHSDINEAIKREKQIKKWNRSWKVELIEMNNPEWRDLYGEIL